MCSAPNLQLTLRLKNGDKQSFSNDVCDTGGQVNLELLHKAVSTMQKDTNEVLTKLVEQERETTKNGNVNNSKTEISGKTKPI